LKTGKRGGRGIVAGKKGKNCSSPRLLTPEGGGGKNVVEGRTNKSENIVLHDHGCRSKIQNAKKKPGTRSQAQGPSPK